jgi:hypothetical protein
MGVLSALPVVSAGNVCCCLWVVTGGLLAAWVLQQDRPSRISPADGAIVGLLAGIIGAIVQQMLAIPIGILVGPMERQILQRLVEASDSMSPGMRDVLSGSGDRAVGWIGLLIVRAVVFFVTLTIGAVVSTVSGLIGAALFGRDAPQPRDLPSSVAPPQ